MADVKDLGEARKKRNAKKREDSGEDKSPQAEFFYQLVQKMNRDFFAPKEWPQFPKRIHVLADEFGGKRVLEELPDRTLSYRKSEAVTDAIIKYCYGELAGRPDAMLSHHAAENCRKIWLSLTDPLKDAPITLAEKSDPRLAFSRLPFDAPVERDEWGNVIVPPRPPCFGEFVGRCTQQEALCAFIGSFFYPEADRHQYAYIHGEGQDGKGALVQFLYKLIGDGAEALQPRKPNDRFWNMRIYGKRVVLFSDCEDFRFFSSADFKSITGGDPIYFEEKGEPGFSDIPDCKVLAASNFKPNISSQRSDLRRLIMIEVTPFQGELVPHYSDLMLGEAEAIVRHCKAVYESLCLPSHGPIPCTPAMDLAVESEELYFSFFHQYFEVASPETWVPGHSVTACRKEAHMSENSSDVAKMKAAWGRLLGVHCRRHGAGVRYWGMRLHCDPKGDDE